MRRVSLACIGAGDTKRATGALIGWIKDDSCAHRRVSLVCVANRWPMLVGVDLFGGPMKLVAEG